MGGVAGHAGLFAPADDVLRFGAALLDVWHGRSDAAAARAPGAEFADAAGPAREIRLGARLGHADAGRVLVGPATSPSSSIGHLGFTGTSLWIDLEAEAVVVMLTNRIHLVAKRSQFTLRPMVHDLIREAFDA